MAIMDDTVILMDDTGELMGGIVTIDKPNVKIEIKR